MKFLVLLFTLLSLIPAPADSTALVGVIEWLDEGYTLLRPAPDELDLKLYRDGSEYEGGSFRFTDTEGAEWSFEYSDLPLGYTYTVALTPPKGYSTDIEQAEKDVFAATFLRITPNNRLTIPLDSINYLAAVKGNSAVVWTLDRLGVNELALLIEQIERVGEASFSKLSQKSISYISGLPAYDRSGLSLKKGGSDLLLEFERPSSWSQVGYGAYTESQTGLKITNTLTESPTAQPSSSPVPSAEPSVVPSIAPSPKPSADPTVRPTTPPVPETGEATLDKTGELIFWVVMLGAGIALAIILRTKRI